MINQLTPQKNKLPSAIKLLLWLSFGLWIYSLFGVGFDSGGKEPEYGLYILTFGSLLGWLGCSPFPTGCAVYANYFYLFALLCLMCGGIPKKSTICMLLLASLTFFLKEVLVNEAGWTTDIDAWGWGAIWWGLSLITLTIATYSKSGKIPLKKSLSITAIIYAVVVFPLIALFLYQYHTANEQEKAQYFIPGIYGLYLGYDRENDEKNNHFYSVAHIFFSGGTAFVVDKNAFSHIKYSTPPALPKNSVLQINGKIDFSENWALIADDLAIGLPSSFVYQGKLYQRQNSRHTYYFIDNYYDASLIKVTPFKNQIDYTMDLSQTNKKGVYRFTISDENKKNIFYQTDMVKKGYSAYPFYAYRDYRYSLNDRTEPLPNQIKVSDKCTNCAALSIKDEHIALSVNNADYIIIHEKDLDGLKKQFCQYRVDDLYYSEDIVIMPVKIMEDDKIDNIIFLVFDKYNMELIDEFNLYRSIYYKNKEDKEYTKNAIQPIIEYGDDRINSDYTFIYIKAKDTPRREESRLLINRLGYILEL